MSNRCYLFGAGAESNFKLATGYEFAKNVVGIGTEEMNDALYTYFSKKQYREACWYPTYSKGNKYTFDDVKLVEACVRKHLMGMHSKETTKNSFDKTVKEKVDYIMNNSDERKIMEADISYMGLLDSCFHTLIEPKVLGSEKFWRVITCYYRGYLTIVSPLVYDASTFTAEQYIWILEHPKEVQEKVADKCEKMMNSSNYYQILRDYEKDKIRILTTNYTPFANFVSTDEGQESVAYLNGRLGLFEAPRILKTYDVIKDSLPQDELLFPYIFVQSGIKPVVEITQIQEYSKMLHFLDESDEIVVVGYSLNSDDNHINSIIRSYVEQGRKLVYFAYAGETKEMVERRLRMEQNSHISVIEINQDNALERFKEYVLCEDMVK